MTLSREASSEHATQNQIFTPYSPDAPLRLFSLLDEDQGESWRQSDGYKASSEWLKDHTDEIAQLVDLDIATTTYHHESSDIERLRILNDGNTHYKEQGRDVSKMFLASDILYGSMRGTTDKIIAQPGETLDDVLERIRSEDIVRAIGAQLVRAQYLYHLSEKHPEDFSRKQLDGLMTIYRNNIESNILVAGHHQKRMAKLAIAQLHPEDTPILRRVA